VELARLQVEAGAIGVCTATVWEAIVAGRAGIQDVLIANQVGGRDKIRALAAAAQADSSASPWMTTERGGSVRAAAAAHSDWCLSIEVDVGMRRGGVRSAEEAVVLAQRLINCRGSVSGRAGLRALHARAGPRG
jgi:D-serine deaminase-like pyridoxal phosphate-dependent protein